jgi:AcrR family transcriptional regulator
LVKAAKVRLEPRKTPVQARSTASVEAIREATVQVLLRDGKEGLTTRKVADRAGVSVGTLYQYFPNKSSLLQAALREHLAGVARAVESICVEMHGATLDAMAEALVKGFLAVKLKDVETSRALYFVSDDLEAVKIARENALRNVEAVAGMLLSAKDGLRGDARAVSMTVLAAMAGVSRRMLESMGEMTEMGRELERMVRAYLVSCRCCAGGE